MLGVPKMPAIMVMVPTKAENAGSIGFAPTYFDRKQFGGIKFLNVMQYLLTVQAQLSQSGALDELFGAVEPPEERSTSKSNVASVEIFEVTADTPDFCSPNQLGLCVIAILDGSSGNEQKEEQLTILKEVQEHPANRDRVLKFMWVDAVCHPSFGEAFGVGLDKAPTVIAISPKRQKFSTLLTSFTTKSISEFITGVLAGRIPISPYSDMPAISVDDNCEEAHAAFLAPVEEEVDLDDIMAEILADEEKKERINEVQAEDNDSKLALEEEREREHKRKLAQMEIERLNRQSNKKSNRRRRRSRRRKAKHTEL
eukprot:m.37396 g.37396  ORF g.37396 m.37396 type:complete len:312 (+) comp11378_c0_seq1:913-1848(+)